MTEETTQIAWRLNPQISYSDWVMEVTRLPNDLLLPNNKNSKKKDIYHVHKAHLSCGPRKSEYFFGMFHSNRLLANNNSQNNNTTRIRLEDSVADAMPTFLDYVYGGHLELTSPEIAVALHYLSDYFGVEPLKQEVFEFVKTDMMPSIHHQRARMLLLDGKPESLPLEDKENHHQDSDSVILESCMKSATRWNLVRDRLLSPHNDRAGLVELMTQMLTLEQKNLLFFYALREQSNGRCRRRFSPNEWKVQNQQQLVTEAQEMIRVQEEMTVLQERLETLQNQNEAYSHAFGSLKQDKEKLESKNQALEDRTKEMDRLSTEVASLKQSKEEQEQTQLLLRKRVEELELEKTSLEQEMDTQESKISVLYNNTERLERKLCKAKAKNQNKEQLERLKQGHLLEISRIKGESSKLVYQFQVEAARWREENIKLKRQCELLEELYWSGGR